MKKLALTLAILLGLGLTTFADPNQGGGLFQRGAVSDEEYYGTGYFANSRTGGLMPVLPNHGETNNQDGNEGPLGSGIAVLMGLGAAYALAKKKEK